MEAESRSGMEVEETWAEADPSEKGVDAEPSEKEVDAEPSEKEVDAELSEKEVDAEPSEKETEASGKDVDMEDAAEKEESDGKTIEESQQRINGIGSEDSRDGDKTEEKEEESMETQETVGGDDNDEKNEGLGIIENVTSVCETNLIEDDSSENVVSLCETKLIEDDNADLPHGWRKDTIPNVDSGNMEVCYYSPTGDVLRSIEEVKKYCETNGIDLDYSKFDFHCEMNISVKSNSGSPIPPKSNPLTPIDVNSDSQNSTEYSESVSSNSSKVPEKKKTVSTSSLLRAYRPKRSASDRLAGSQLDSVSKQTTNQPNQPKPTKQKTTTLNGSTNDSNPNLVLSCKSEELSTAQIGKIQKLQEELSKLQLMLWNEAQGDKNGGAPPLLNGALGGNGVTAPSLANGTGLVPQFLLLQNGQMVGASLTQASKASTTTSTRASKNKNAGKNASTPQGRSSMTTRQRNAHKPTASPEKPKDTGRSGSPEIEVVKEMRKPSQGQSSTTTLPATPSSGGGSGPLIKHLPLLNIVCRPKNSISPSLAMSQRKELDAKVKAVLVKSAQEFVEWLLSEGLIRTAQYCTQHKLHPSQLPFKLKLGMFSDPKVLVTSGGYVWISECCGMKYVSVYSGSIFGSTPIDKVAPTVVLKLTYHWACQTSILNVQSWVKVEKAFINKMFNYLRCVCSVMLQDKVYDFGFDGTTVELGIVSLGTSTADGTKKAVKVEILGLYDRKMKSYRLFASEPEPGTSSRQRFVRILKPLERVVHTNAILLCDQSVDRNCLYNMNYGKVSVCETSDNEENLQSNAKIMSYLRRHVPKMFQSTLSQLSLQQVQIVLDELCWRERFGNCAAQAYNAMVEHIAYLTSRECENPGVLHLLDFVAQKPHHNWRYKSQHVPKGFPSLQPSIIMSTPKSGTINPQVVMEVPSNARSPLDHKNKVMLTSRTKGGGGGASAAATPRDFTPSDTVSKPTGASKAIEAVQLEPYYYGQIEGDSSLGREINNYTFSCHICKIQFQHNVEFYNHMKGHIGGKTDIMAYCCDYCTDHYSSEESKDYHQKFKHLQMDTRYMWCRICNESFQGEFQLVNHMAKKHFESELPYRCEVCNFATSMYYNLINHFKVEHKGSPYVQCHYCLCVKTITSLSADVFSSRMLQHMQKHHSQQFKCKSCILTFYSKYLLDDHKKKEHGCRVNVEGLQRYKIPAGHTAIMFRPWVKRTAASNAPLKKLPSNLTVAISSTLEKLDSLVVDVDEEETNFYCIECDGNLTLAEHFKAYQKCTKCTYSTCCRNMVSKHALVFHPAKSKSGYYRIGPPIVLPEPMYCICGFSTRSGNHLARHLALCEGGRKSAYPSMLDAMVYRGDPMTPNALALSTLGLSRMLPGSVTPPQAQANEPTFDMSHFMQMSMDVEEDEEDDPPIMPVSVELAD